MNIERAGALALGLGTLAMVAVMATHPSGHVPSDPLLAAHVRLAGIVVHALAIGVVPLLVFGGYAITRLAGFDKPLAVLALAFYAFGGVAVLGAAAMSGFVQTRIMERYAAAAAADQAALHMQSQLVWFINQAFANIHVALFSVAIVLWSLAWPGKGLLQTAIQFAGLLIGLGVIAWQVSGLLTLDVFGMGAVVLAQAVWFALAVAGLVHGSHTRAA